MMTMSLIAGDILRDGGSLAVEFRLDDGSLLSVLLEVAGAPEPGEERRFKHLHVGPAIQNSCDPGTVIVKGSEAEAALLRDMDETLGMIGFDLRPEQKESYERLAELRRSLATREE